MDDEGASSSGFSTTCDRDSGFDTTSREAMYKNKGNILCNLFFFSFFLLFFFSNIRNKQIIFS